MPAGHRDVRVREVNILRAALRRSMPEHRPPSSSRRLAEASEAFNALARSALVDTGWYRGKYGFSGGRLDACFHYLNEGVDLGWDPHPLFSTRWYLTAHPEVLASGQNPLHHYLASGSGDGLWPHPLVDPGTLPTYGGSRGRHAGLTDLELYVSSPETWSARKACILPCR